MAVRPGSHIRNPRRGNVSQSVFSAFNFTPLHLSPQLWLDASDTSTITESGGAVSQWNDKSGNGYNFSQGTAAAQPTTGVTLQNGLNVLNFDGGDNLLAANASDWKFLHDGTDYIIAVAARITSNTGGYMGNMEGGSGQTGVYLFKTGTSIFHYVRNDPNIVLLNTPSNIVDTSFRVVSVLSDPDNATAVNRSRIFVDRGLQNANSTNTAAPSSSNPGQVFRVGSMVTNAGASVFFMTGSIAEIIIVSGSAAIESNRILLRDYLNNKWRMYA